MARLLDLALITTAFLVGQWNFSLATTIGVRNGDHPGFSRIVLELPEGFTATAVQRGDRVLVRFLALQLHFKFKVRPSCCCLVLSSEVGPLDDV